MLDSVKLGALHDFIECSICLDIGDNSEGEFAFSVLEDILEVLALK